MRLRVYFTQVGLGADLALCAHADRHQIVPMMCDRVITAPVFTTDC